MDISNRLFHIMEQKGLRMVDLASLLGVSKSVISTWKSRGTNPPVEYAVLICNFLGVSPDYFLTGEESVSRGQNNATLNKEEQELLNNYNNLDSRGRHRLHTVAYEELDRISDNINRVEREKSNAG